MRKVEVTIAVLGVLVGIAGVYVAILQYQASPPAPVIVQTVDPELKALITSLVAKNAKEGKTLVAPPVVTPAKAPPKHSTSQRAAELPTGTVKTSGRVSAGRDPEPTPSPSKCEKVTLEFDNSEGGVRAEEKYYCLGPDGRYEPVA